VKKYYSAIPNDIEMGMSIGLLYAFNRKVHGYNRPKWADSLFIDSGGYVAWKRGKPIDIEKYHEFINMNNGIIDIYAALDEIGDEKKSMELFEHSLNCGFNPVPIYHEYDSIDTLNFYLDRSEHVGIAAINKGSRPKKCNFIEHCFRHIPDDVKIHGFGFLDTHIMSTYAFDSVDGTYAFRLARFGMVITPIGTLRFNESEMRKWEIDPFKQSVIDYMLTIGIDYELLKSYDRDGMVERIKASVVFFESIESPDKRHSEMDLFSLC